MKQDYELFAVLSYGIWNNINEMHFNGLLRDPLAIVTQACQHLAAFREATALVSSAPSPPQNSGWTKPPSPHFKVNFDASVSTVGEVIGIGVVIRDYDGLFVAGLSKRLDGTMAPDLAEALAAREACLLAKVLMIPSFILEGDLSSVINLINLIRGFEDILSKIGLVIEDVRLAL